MDGKVFLIVLLLILLVMLGCIVVLRMYTQNSPLKEENALSKENEIFKKFAGPLYIPDNILDMRMRDFDSLNNEEKGALVGYNSLKTALPLLISYERDKGNELSIDDEKCKIHKEKLTNYRRVLCRPDLEKTPGG